VVAQGELKVGQGITFDKASITVEHKMDIDTFEDGCIESITIELGRGFGCTLHVEANTATAPGGGLRITNLTFAADSQCPGFPDESEGQYNDFSRMKVLAIVPGIDKVPDTNAPSSCFSSNFEIKLEGVLVDSAQKTLNVASTSILVSGEVSSTGSTTASCPCQASCSGKDCGSDGCGFTCGVCDANEECNGAGQCQCIPDCDGKECGDDGCGGSCGACGAFEACQSGACVECQPTCGETAECGDNGCGGTCGTCDTNETCSAAKACTCPGTQCSGECCKSGDKCSSGECCTPQCGGKQCGSDGCGGTCGTCSGTNVCQANGTCSCTPQGDGKECGDNGCGGSCGACGGGETCQPGGICATVTASCDFTGFAGLSQIAVDNTSNITYQQFTDAGDLTGPFDVLQLEMWQTANGYEFESGFEFPIDDTPYESCALCLVVQRGCANQSCAAATLFLATEGVVGFNTFATAAGQTLEGYIRNAVLHEATINSTTGASTLKPNGKTLCITDPIPVGPADVIAPTP